MKVKILKGTTYRGTSVNPGDILDLDAKDYSNFVHVWRDAEPYTEPAPVKAEPAAAVQEAPVEDKKKGKK